MTNPPFEGERKCEIGSSVPLHQLDGKAQQPLVKTAGGICKYAVRPKECTKLEFAARRCTHS